MKRNWKTYLFWIALAEGVGALAGWLTREGTAYYKEFVEKPALAPPALVFPIVWGILYAIMGFGAARVSLTEPSPARSLGLNLWTAQLVVNFGHGNGMVIQYGGKAAINKAHGVSPSNKNKRAIQHQRLNCPDGRHI